MRIASEELDKEKFDELFDKIVERLKEKGIISEDDPYHYLIS